MIIRHNQNFSNKIPENNYTFVSYAQMKKFAVVILALLYLTTSTGANLNLHYCMGELADWGLGENKSKTCGFCGMAKGGEKDNGCCKDEQKFVKNDTDQKVIESSLDIIKVIAAAPLPEYSEFPVVLLSSLTELRPVSNAPPRTKGQALYILNSTFLI